jgi:hypothetical protein
MKQRLTVHEMPIEGCWKDMAGVPERYRVDAKGRTIRRGQICDVTISGKHKLLAIRGCSPTAKDARIQLDHPTQSDLDVQPGDSCEVEFRPTGLMGYLRWGWRAIDPSYRVPFQISMVSFFLGLVGLLLGILGVCPIVHGWIKGK